MNRKEFVKNAGLAAASLTVLPTATLFPKKRSADPKIKMAIIGVGLRGQNHLDLLLRRADVDVTAICDVDERSLKSSKDMISKSGKKMPVVYTGDNYAWKKIL